MSMTTTGAQANGLAAARAETRGDQERANQLWRAVDRETKRLRQRGKDQQADALVTAFRRGHGGAR